MSQYLELHPTHPQPRLVRRAAEIIRDDGVIAFPTDSGYALGCPLGSKTGVDRIRQIRALDKDHNFTLVCRDLKEVATYARVENAVFRLLKHATPGPFTFILPATREVPRRLVHPKRRTVGLRVPDHAVPRALLEELGEPLMSVSLLLPELDEPLTDGVDIRGHLEHVLDLIVDGGHCGVEPTSVIDLSGDDPIVVRRGKGDVSAFT